MNIFCFGDSNTYGYDPRSAFGDRYPADCRWVDLLGEQLGAAMVNAGENGRGIPGWDSQFRAFHRQLMQHPVDLLIILLGTNDLLQGASPEETAARMGKFLTQIPLEKNRILLVAPPPMQLGEWVPSRDLICASQALIAEYHNLSQSLGIRFADPSEWKVPLCYDGVHFTEAGHRVFAEGLADYINKGE